MSQNLSEQILKKSSSVYHCFFRRHVCLSHLKHARSRELSLTACRTAFSLLKLPIVVIEKCCYHGSVTSHFSSLISRVLFAYCLEIGFFD